jgi:hypothetical protein
VVTYTQFIRKASLVVGGVTDGIDLSNLQFKFSVKLAEISHPQYATFRIYNIGKDTLNQIKANEYRRVIFQAGYDQGNYGQVFDGEVIQGRQLRESPVDTCLDLLCAVGYSANQAGISTTLAAGSTATDGAKAAAAAMGVPITNNSKGTPPQMPRGQVLYGMAHETLSAAADGLGATWHHSATGIQVVDIKTYAPGDALVLNATTGMIGWPEQTQEGIKIRCLLNPRVGVGTIVQLNNASIQKAEQSADTRFINIYPTIDADGLYKVLYYEHSGDTRGNEWYTDIIGTSINQTADGGISSLIQRGLT